MHHSFNICATFPTITNVLAVLVEQSTAVDVIKTNLPTLSKLTFKSNQTPKQAKIENVDEAIDSFNHENPRSNSFEVQRAKLCLSVCLIMAVNSHTYPLSTGR